MCDGDHTGEAYSTRGLTYVINARLKFKMLRDKKERNINEERRLARETNS